MLDYSYHANSTKADTVVFGDSSAFLGIDPRLIDRELGTHTVVLPNTIGSLQVTGDMALRRYLAVNSQPRVIVFFFTPWDLNFRHASRPEFLFEGEEMLLRNGTLGDIANFALHHPKTFLRFPLQVNALLDFHDLQLALRTDRRQQAIAGHGHLNYTDPVGSVPPNCSLPSSYLHAADTSPIRSLIKQYTTPQTTVLLYLSPIPSCNNAGEVAMQHLRGLPVAAPQALPPEWFAADGMYAHILPTHVAAGTQLLVNALRPLKIDADSRESSKPSMAYQNSVKTTHE